MQLSFESPKKKKRLCQKKAYLGTMLSLSLLRAYSLRHPQ